jgi:hypothetical protein
MRKISACVVNVTTKAKNRINRGKYLTKRLKQVYYAVIKAEKTGSRIKKSANPEIN